MATEIALALHWGRILVVPHGLASEAQSQYSALLVLAILCWLTLTAFTETYRPHRTERLNFLARALTRTLLIWALITVTAVFSLKFEYRQPAVYCLFRWRVGCLHLRPAVGNHSFVAQPPPLRSPVADRSRDWGRRGDLRAFRPTSDCHLSDGLPGSRRSGDPARGEITRTATDMAMAKEPNPGTTSMRHRSRNSTTST